MIRKPLIPIALAILSTTIGCSTWQRLGTLTMMSTRNVDSNTEYVELARYVDSESREAKNAIKRTTVEAGKKLEMAVDRCVATVPGGEFLKNVQIYMNGSEVKVVGDVWGKATGYSLSLDQQKVLRDQSYRDSINRQRQINAEQRKQALELKRQKQKDEKQQMIDSFSVRDMVTWNNMGKYATGEIIGKDTESAAIKTIDKTGQDIIKKVRYQYLTKIVK
jgi:hypothetical protein